MAEITLTQESFDALLAWLDPDRDTAAQKFETIRQGLIRMFRREFTDPEEQADQVIDRVIAKLPTIVDTYAGDPTHYFYGVARYVAHERRRRKEIPFDVAPVAPVMPAEPEDSGEYDCLTNCLKFLAPDKRDLVLEFYRYEKREKIIHRKRLAEKLKITETTLRVRAHRIRLSLEKCVVQCVNALA